MHEQQKKDNLPGNKQWVNDDLDIFASIFALFFTRSAVTIKPNQTIISFIIIERSFTSVIRGNDYTAEMTNGR